MDGRDIYVKLVDPAGAHRPVVNHHRVWDAELFIASQVEQYQGPKVKDGDRRVVSVATEDEYRRANRRAR